MSTLQSSSTAPRAHKPGAAPRDLVETLAGHGWPNFDYLRLLAAATVIFSHSFLIAEGTEANEPFVRLLGEHNILGFYGVLTFFVISGFLVTRSALNSRNLARYALKRALRILPGLAVCLLLTSVVLGAAFTSSSSLDYLTGLRWLSYTVKSTLLLGDGWMVASVHFYQDALRLGKGLNGSLWTIRQEVACYVIIGLLLFVRQLRWPSVLATFLCVEIALLFWIDPSRTPELLSNFLSTAPSFFAGSLIALLWRDGRLPRWPMLICLAVGIVGLFTHKTMELFSVSGSYPLIWLATCSRPRLPSMKRIGDISYGTYLYGWPVQQTWRALLGPGTSWWGLFLLSLVTAAALGWASWRLVEERALAWKVRLAAA